MSSASVVRSVCVGTWYPVFDDVEEQLTGFMMAAERGIAFKETTGSDEIERDGAANIDCSVGSSGTGGAADTVFDTPDELLTPRLSMERSSAASVVAKSGLRKGHWLVMASVKQSVRT